MSGDEQIPFNNRTHDRLTELETHRVANTKAIEYWGKQIEGLKKKTDFKLLVGLAGDQATKINKNIDEIKSLKELVLSNHRTVIGYCDELKGFTHNQSDDKWSVIKNIEEVLGEALDRIDGYDIEMRDLIDKLGGEKAGSDSSSLNHPKDVRDGTLNQNSKPLRWHFKTPRDEGFLDEPFEFAGHTINPYPSPYSKEQEDFAEHVGRIIGKENSDDYILVKRANLQEWHDYLKENGDPYWKEMEKYLGGDT